MVLHNMFTCHGFSTEILAGCSLSWVGIVILFFIGAALRRWGGEEFDIPFNFISCLVIGFLVYVVIITFTGSPRWSLLGGLIALVIAGYGTPYLYEEGIG
jgi:hypothetical protein